MANCCICGKKVNVLTTDFYLDVDHRACKDCFAHLETIYVTNKSKMNEVYESRKWIEDRMSHVDQKTAELLQARLDRSKELEKETEGERNNIIERERIKQDAIKNYDEKLRNFKTTTGYNFEGYQIIDYKNILNGEVVLGTGFFSELNAGISDALGTSASGYGGKLGRAKSIALTSIIKNAMSIGANALIGVDYDIMTIGSNMIVVSANGTAVNIEKI